MSGSVMRTYSADKVLILVNGIQMTGLADGSFLTIAPMSDMVTSQAGADGEIARALNTDRRSEITLTLQQTSAGNDVLATLATIDGLTAGGVFPFMVTDMRGRTMFAASQCWIKRLPDISFDREITEREWKLEAGAGVYTVGGNT